MDSFITKHREKITGVISIFDRIIFKGYLFFRYPGAVEDFIAHQGISLKDFKGFVKNRSEEIKANAMALASRTERPSIYFNHGFRKEKEARRIARRDGITKGLICIFAVREQNGSFSLRYGENRPRLVSCTPPCLTLYFYFIDEQLGFIHIRLSTWLPYAIQIYINGHEWLARQFDRKGIGYANRCMLKKETHEHSICSILTTALSVVPSCGAKMPLTGFVSVMSPITSVSGSAVM